MPWVVSIILVLLPENIRCCSQEWKMTPSWERGQDPDGPREICCSSRKGWVCLHECLRHRVTQSWVAQSWLPQQQSWGCTSCKGRLLRHDRFLLSCSPPSSYIPSLLRINVLVFCQPPFQPKGIPTHSHHYTGEIISSALKKKNKPTVKSQQKETTSVGCKMTKRKANECPGRGPAIAEKCNLERGIRGAFAAKHMSRAVPETVCLFFSRSQLKKAVRALQAVFQFWPRDFAKQRDYSICMKIVLEAVRKNCSNEILICRCIYSWNTACK